VTESTGLIPLRRKGVARAAGTSPVPVTRRAFIETYGCQMNIGDSELMAGALARRGYVTVDDPERADVIVINTCAIREHAETRVLGRIGQLQVHRRSNPELVLAVTGCMAQRLGETLLDKAAGWPAPTRIESSARWWTSCGWGPFRAASSCSPWTRPRTTREWRRSGGEE
jgi:hypothetical protein